VPINPSPPTETAQAPARRRPQSWMGPSLATGGIVAAAVFILWLMDRPWWCSCGEPFPFSGDAFSRHNSQHLADPYTLAHSLKGLIYFGLFAWAFPKLPFAWGLTLAIGLESAWELIENSPPVIERYRTATIALGYQGDTIPNSLGDIVGCAVAFWLAPRLGFRGSLAVFLVTETVLLFWIRDNLTVSTLMLIYPIEAIKTWQTGG